MVIGKDTRLSGYMLENALTAGLCSTGMNVLLLGPVPTPAVGFLTRSMRADLGVMISASHNPHQDNGIKFFGPDGFKLSDEAEAEIEAMVAGEITPAEPGKHRPGQADRRRARALSGIRQDDLSGGPAAGRAEGGDRLRQRGRLQGRAGGAVGTGGRGDPGRGDARTAPISTTAVGSTHTQTAAEAVVAHGAHVGISLDGDADRVMILDETGRVADGDQIMALLAGRWAEEGRLNGGTLVATVMSQSGAGAVPDRAGVCGWSARRSATAMWSRRCGAAAGTLAASSRAIS